MLPLDSFLTCGVFPFEANGCIDLLTKRPIDVFFFQDQQIDIKEKK